VRRYLVVIERGERSYSAFVPDLPGCIATGRTRSEVVQRMQEAIEMHVEALRGDGLPVPEPTTDGEWVDVEADVPPEHQRTLRVRRSRTVAT
jgi:predicted RNase H-like HicB family nuclease